MLQFFLPLAMMQATRTPPPTLAPPAPVPASQPILTLDQQAALRCSAAFAIVAAGQARGEISALEYPALNTRGKEFFVRSMAQVMDDTSMGRAEVSALVSGEAKALADGKTVADTMPGCLLLLDVSGL